MTWSLLLVVPQELVAALPEDFQAAFLLAGYLTCVTDTRGRLRFSQWFGLSKSDDSSAFKDITDALDGTGMLRFSPPGVYGNGLLQAGYGSDAMFGAQWLVDWREPSTWGGIAEGQILLHAATWLPSYPLKWQERKRTSRPLVKILRD